MSSARDPVWRVLARVRGADAASAVFAILDDAAGAVSAFETESEEWRLDAYPQSPLLTAEFSARIALAAAAAGGVLAEIAEEKLPTRNWAADNQLAFPPLRVGRFFIYGSHYCGSVPGGAIGILVDAAIAFGTGEHPSTQACLVALEGLARRRRFRQPLDIGTGTGILSIATAKLLRRKIIAGDIDPNAVRVARLNVARNGVLKWVQVLRAAGYRDRTICKAHYDLIFANILARPLALMAADLARVLAPGGRAVLSGLLRRQEPVVLAPHRGCGIVLDRRLLIDGWSTLVLRRRGPDVTMGAKAPISEFGAVERPVRLPLAGRVSPVSGTVSAAGMRRAWVRHQGEPRFANGAARYRRANGHRGPSVRRRPYLAGAIRKSALLPT
ncbi:MAG: 50S ribosomal protein L11 methyltransferase [Stellaceae bacterium]